MAKTLNELEEAALALGTEDRGALADILWESLLTEEEREIQAEWIAVAERRLDEMRRGDVQGIPWEKVRADLRAKLDAKRRSSRRR
jgi:putative addiction module component (TIGR02574 family)